MGPNRETVFVPKAVAKCMIPLSGLTKTLELPITWADSSNFKSPIQLNTLFLSPVTKGTIASNSFSFGAPSKIIFAFLSSKNKSIV